MLSKIVWPVHRWIASIPRCAKARVHRESVILSSSSSSATTMSLAQKLPLNIQGKNIIRDLPTKLRKRALLSQRQAQRHRKREDESKELAKKSERIFEGAFRSQLWREKVRTERKSRREDLISGPLAPRRDYGNKAATYGSLSVAEIFGTEKYQYKNYGLVAGDRVVIIKAGHPDLGKIARVKEIREKAEECVLDGLNKVSHG